MSMAENWFIRPELIEICKAAMEKYLAPHVGLPSSYIHTPLKATERVISGQLMKSVPVLS